MNGVSEFAITLQLVQWQLVRRLLEQVEALKLW